MKTIGKVALAMAASAILVLPVKAQPRVNFWLQIGTPPANRFYVSLSEYYDVPYRDIYVMHEAGVVDDDIPVILYIYTNSHYSLRQIYSLRLRGATWDNLSNWCGVPLYREHFGPPYGRAYGYYRNGPGRYRFEPRARDRDGDEYYGRAWDGERGRERYRGERSEGDD